MGELVPVQTLPIVAVRRLLLAHTGLLRWQRGRPPHAEGAPWREQLHGEVGALEALRRLEAVQVDPVAVVDRNHHLVLRNRVGAYRPEHLEALYHRRLVFEYEANARCVLPIEDYPLFEPVRERFRADRPAWPAALDTAMRDVAESLGAKGPLPARHLESDERVAGYWDDAPRTKATSQALEHLWELGEVVVAFRRGDERHFALTRDWLSGSAASTAAAGEARPAEAAGADPWEPLLRKYLRAYGVADPADFRFGWRKWSAKERRSAVERLTREGVLVPVELAGVRRRYFVLADLVPLLTGVSRARVAPDVYLLPPLDNVVWRRERLVDLFGFEYTWEIYVPPRKRRFGPYSMPVLEGDRFVGRLDARMNRAGGALHVERMTFEPGVEPSARRLQSVREAIESLAADLGAGRVDYQETHVPG